jgi:hypothetical protein
MRCVCGSTGEEPFHNWSATTALRGVDAPEPDALMLLPVHPFGRNDRYQFRRHALSDDRVLRPIIPTYERGEDFSAI